MCDRQLSLACDLNLVTWPLYEGSVEPKGVELNFLAFDDVVAAFNRMIRHQEFEISEMSMSSYLMSQDRGRPAFTAIPVFPSRVFRHGFIFVNSSSGINEPKDLVGADVGVPSYTMTAALWARGVLEHDYGVTPAEVTWHQAKPQGTGKDDPLAFELPDEVTVRSIPEGQALDEMISSGAIDALVTPKLPRTFDGELVRRLFPDFRAREADYYERTGFFPIMHTIVVRDDVLEADPWVATELTDAFTRAKDEVFDELQATIQRRLSIPWVYELFEEVQSMMGEDFWPYGVEPNRSVLQAMTQYAHEQGFTSRHLDVDELFAPNTY